MKKLFAIVLLGFLLLGYIGCGGGGVTTTASAGHSLVTMNLGMTKALRAGAVLRPETGIPPDVTMIRITVSAPDLVPSLVFNIDLSGLSSLEITIEVPNGLNRHFLIEALDASGRVLYSGVTDTDLDGTPVSLSVLLASTDPLPPAFAGITRVQNPTLNSLTLVWSPASDNVSTADKIQYLIYMSTSSNGEDMNNPYYITPDTGLVPVNGEIFFVVNSLQPATTYFFKVRARDERGNVDTNTVEKSGTTLSPEVNPPPPPPTPPDQQFVDFTPSNGRLTGYLGMDLTFSVVNNGNIPAYNVPVWVLFEDWSGISCKSFNYRNANPGIPVQFTVQWVYFPNYLIIVDPKNTFAESNESNNTGCGGTYCNNPPSIPNVCVLPID